MRIGLALFPGLCQLDMTGPHEVLVRLPDAQVEVVAKTVAPVTTDRGLTVTPDVALSDAPQYDVFVMPGGPGQQDLMDDADWLNFLRDQAIGAKVMMGVCTGSLVMGAAGLLRGYKATTHWSCHDLLAILGRQTPHDRHRYAFCRFSHDEYRRRRNRIGKGCSLCSGYRFKCHFCTKMHGLSIIDHHKNQSFAFLSKHLQVWFIGSSRNPPIH